jgi:peptidoglycan DL-endopeptidase CwlO
MRHWRVLFVAAAVMATGCATGSGRPPVATTPERGPRPPEARSGSGDAALGHRVVADALDLRGVPYRNGGVDPRGFDCSGFVAYVLARHGLAVPRQTAAQFKAGVAVSRGELQPGDLVFFTTVAPGASHVGIALDDDEFVHAPSSRGVVRVERLTLPYWQRRFVGARRVR